MAKKPAPLILALLMLVSAPAITSAESKRPRTPEDAVTPVEYGDLSGLLKTIERRGGNIDLVLLGDTITEFWSKTGKDSYAELEGWSPLNLGFGGQCTEHVLWRIQNGILDGYQAKAVMIMIGSNNIGRFGDEQPEWVAAGIKKIVETVKEKQPQAKILLLGIFPRGSTTADKNNMRIMETNELLPTLADDKTVFYMDIGKSFLNEGGDVKPELMPEYFIPNAEGYKAWLDAVKPKLSELMK